MIATPPVALAVSPARLVVAAGETAQLHVTNGGARPAVVDVASAGFALSLRGRARIFTRAAPVGVSQRRLKVPARATATLVVTAPHVTRAGDHPALVLLTTRPSRTAIAVRMRFGIVVFVRVPGRVVHRVVPERLRGARGKLELWLRNAGNAAERVDGRTVRVRLVRNGTVVARARLESRELLPRARGVCALRYPARVHGAVRAVVEVAVGRRVLRRTFRLRL